jgi:uncharacterized Zn finger protein (UPF0148 family)
MPKIQCAMCGKPRETKIKENGHVVCASCGTGVFGKTVEEQELMLRPAQERNAKDGA